MLSMIFSRSTLKMLVALSIPVGIAVLFWWAQKTADEQIAETKGKLVQHESQDVITLVDYKLKEVDDANRIRWQLIAKKGIVDQGTQIVTLRDVKVEYYDGDKIKMRLTSPVGEANQQTKYVKLYGENGRRVEAEGEAGKAKMLAATVELKEKNQFLASGGVNIDWPQVAKVSGNSATGSVDLADFKHFKIMGNTHALIFVN
jgi:LPS export ABC transporter protein LptC